MENIKLSDSRIFVPKAAMFGMLKAFCFISVFCHLPNIVSCRRQCSYGTFPSHVLDGCADCPPWPKIHCRYEDARDIDRCLKSCKTGKCRAFLRYTSIGIWNAFNLYMFEVAHI
jgi:hypothetical protein